MTADADVEPDELLLAPWRKMLHTTNVILANAVLLCLTESIIYGVFWFLTHILHTEFPPIVQRVASATTFVGVLAFVLRYCYEDLTEHGKQLKAANREFFRNVGAKRKKPVLPQGTAGALPTAAALQAPPAQVLPAATGGNIQPAPGDQNNVQQVQAGNNNQQSP